jgi:hypothetical protein
MIRRCAVPLLFAVVLCAAPTAAQDEETNPCGSLGQPCMTASDTGDQPGICVLTTCIYRFAMPRCDYPHDCALCLRSAIDAKGGVPPIGGSSGVAGVPDCRSLGGTAFATGGSAPTGGQYQQQDWGCDDGSCDDDEGCSVGPGACIGAVAATTTTVPWPMLAMAVLGLLRRAGGRGRWGSRRER